MAEGAAFTSDTDTEVIAHLVTREIRAGNDPVRAVYHTLKRLEGAFAIAMIFRGYNDLMIVARQGSPLAIGYGEGEMFVGSDALALAPFTDEVAYLEDGDWAVLTREGVAIRDRDGKAVQPAGHQVAGHCSPRRQGQPSPLHGQGDPRAAGGRRPHACQYCRLSSSRVELPELPFDFATLGRLSISACGTAFYAGLVAKYWFERWARLPVDVDIASEFRYRQGGLDPGGAALFISQSGETADTLATLRYCREQGQRTVSIVNVRESSIARESDCGAADACRPRDRRRLHQGLHLPADRARLPRHRRRQGARAYRPRRSRPSSSRPCRGAAPHGDGAQGRKALTRALAHSLSRARDVLYLGRGQSYPIALEGALKLKEISYIHAEGYAAGELKHGPIALIDENMPVIVIAPRDDLYDKTVSNMQEVAARGGQIVLVSDADPSSTGCAVRTYLKVPGVAPLRDAAGLCAAGAAHRLSYGGVHGD